MDATLLLLIFLLPVLLLVIATAAASETTFFSMTRTDRFRLRRRSPHAAAATNRLLARPRALVLAILLVITAANVAFYVIVTLLERRIGHGLLGAVFSVTVLLVLVLVGDLLPKLLAASNLVAFAQFLAPWLRVAIRIVAPLTNLLETYLVVPVLRLIRTGETASPRVVTVDELGALLDLSARSGEIAQDEQRLLADVIRLGATRVRDVMIPRVAMPWVSDRYVPQDVIRALRKSPLERIPVFRGSLDGKPVGMLDARAFLVAAETPSEPRVHTPRDPRPAELGAPVFIPERARMDQLLDLLRRGRCEHALCVDEYGAVVGLITINEVLRELVATGPGTEEAGEAAIQRRSANCWVVPGRLPARELAAQLDHSAAKEAGAEVSTVAGLFFQHLGRIPSVGDIVRLGNVELSVENMSGRSIDRVAVTLLSSKEGAA